MVAVKSQVEVMTYQMWQLAKQNVCINSLKVDNPLIIKGKHGLEEHNVFFS